MWMNSKKPLVLIAFSALLALSSCSGLKNVCTTNCTPTGNATLSITLFDTPPTGINLLSFTLPIAGISLTPSSGSPVAVATTSSSFEVTHLQTDSALIADAVSVPIGSYTALSVTVGPTTATSNVFINTSGSTITWTTGAGGSCLNGAVCNLPAGAIFTVSIPVALSLSANQDQWIGLNLNLNNAVTATGGLSVDFSQTGVLTAITTARTGIPSPAVDTVEDFVGAVTAFSSSSITVKSGISGQTLTASLTTNTEYDTPSSPSDAYSNCTAAPACIAVGSTVSVDAQLDANGTLTATEVDVLDVTAVDEVEGVIYPTSTPNVYGLILADKVSASGNAALASTTTTYGSGVFLNVASANFFVDTKTLSIALPSPIGFPGSGLLAGQVVRAQVTNVTSTNTGITATATNLLLRWSRLTGTVSATASPNFNFTPTSYITVLDTGLGQSPLAYTFINYTAFDGITDSTGIATSSTVSIRTLLLNNAQPTFAVAKVRVP